ncbi:hypothetical protein LRA02_19910 [Lentilactobacillus rapi]|uniref:Uncharacterized protein n=1 Tax=Lentilactobacillus rapi TaxID=481723 RepID=A0A512PPK6_9LACO|nr:hypothetical protein LRA02_19910 [Lentilactobacillus rapi]
MDSGNKSLFVTISISKASNYSMFDTYAGKIITTTRSAAENVLKLMSY